MEATLMLVRSCIAILIRAQQSLNCAISPFLRFVTLSIIKLRREFPLIQIPSPATPGESCYEGFVFKMCMS